MMRLKLSQYIVNLNIFFCCGLKFESNGGLSVASLGGKYGVEDHLRQIEYYKLKTDPIKELKREGYTLSNLENNF